MGDATWKSTERRIARRLGGHRLGNTGQSSPDVVDGSGYLLIEIKHRKALPVWLKTALAKVRACCAPDQTGIVVLHEAGQRSDNDLVVMSMTDFERLWT